ncbi:hypothetical protein V8F06_000365 [Rhypophila decipiens]
MSQVVSPVSTAPYSPSAELDGGDPAIRFSLASSANSIPFSTSPQTRRQIFVRRQAWDKTSRILAVVERTVLKETEETIRESERYLDLHQDLVLPVYALPRPSTREWNIEIAYAQGNLRVDYPFGTSQDAFHFQEVLTGYVPVAQFDDVTCVVTYNKGIHFQKPQYAGFGQVQFWKQPEQKQPTFPPTARSLSPVSSTGSSGPTFTAQVQWGAAGPRAQATSPTPTWSSPRPRSIASVQTTKSVATVQTYDPKGTSVLVTQDIRPPLLVAFLKDIGKREGYTMLKVDITDLTQTEFTNARKEDAALMLADSSKSSFHVKKHLAVPGRVPLSAWNLCCEPQPRFDKRGNKIKTTTNPLVDQLDSSHMMLSFGSRKDPANLVKREKLDKCMLKLQVRHRERLAGQTATRDEGIAVMAEEMRAPPPPPPGVFVPPGIMATPRRPRIYEPPELIPEMERQSVEIGTDFILQAGTADSHRAAMTAELPVVNGPR